MWCAGRFRMGEWFVGERCGGFDQYGLDAGNPGE